MGYITKKEFAVLAYVKIFNIPTKQVLSMTFAKSITYKGLIINLPRGRIRSLTHNAKSRSRRGILERERYMTDHERIKRLEDCLKFLAKEFYQGTPNPISEEFKR